MKYFLLSLRLSLRRSMGGVRFWCALLLVLALGAAVRGVLRPSAEAAVQVGAVIPAGGEAFREALERRSGDPVRFVFTDESTARKRVAAGQWDCALLLPDDFAQRLSSGEQERLVTLVTGPGSAVYPLVRETAAAALLELTTARIAADYLRSSGIAAGTAEAWDALPPVREIQLKMETLDGRPLDQPALAENSAVRVLRGSLAAAMLVWTLFAAVDLGRWRQTGIARRMRPCLGGVLLSLPRLLASLIPAFCLGAAGLLAAGSGGWSVLALGPYLAALGALTLLLSAFPPVWEALPSVIPFAAAAVFLLSPVFVDITLFFPQLAPLCRWLPATLYLQGCEGDGTALACLTAAAAGLAGAAAGLEALHK